MTNPLVDRRVLMQMAALSAAVAAEAVSGVSQAQTAAPQTVIAEITARPDQADAFRALFVTFAASVRTEPGCLQYTVLEDEATPGHLFTYEAWSDKTALDAHMNAPSMKALGAKAGAMLAKPPSITRLKKLGAS
jgi:quinol monooxygenase YgiN